MNIFNKIFGKNNNGIQPPQTDAVLSNGAITLPLESHDADASANNVK